MCTERCLRAIVVVNRLPTTGSLEIPVLGSTIWFCKLTTIGNIGSLMWQKICFWCCWTRLLKPHPSWALLSSHNSIWIKLQIFWACKANDVNRLMLASTWIVGQRYIGKQYWMDRSDGDQKVESVCRMHQAFDASVLNRLPLTPSVPAN